MLILIVVTLIQRSIGFGRGILFCRWLTPETLGQWELTYSFLLLAAPLAVLGVPGSFGRYLERFRQQGHLHTFLQRTMLWTALCTVLAVGTVVWCAPWFSYLLFCNYDSVNLVRGIALCLAAIILHHTLTSLLTALRLFRVVSAMNFAQSLLFASLAIGLLWFNASVTSILLGYGIACLVASLGAAFWVWPELREIDRPQEHLPQRNFWPQLMRFAFFVWLTNLLAHLFAVIDRYMLMHYSGMTDLEAQIQVGQYHSSRIVPLLLISFADLLSGLVMPHLSSDWEAGRRKQVGTQLNLSLKLTGLGMLCFGVCVLLFAPLLFDVILQGKYNNGLVVLPWTLAGCVWYGIYALAQNYLWCAEKARLATLPLALGLMINVALNLLLLPLWGLYGAVAATAISSFICLFAILLLSKPFGLPLDRGTWLTAAAPLSLAAGPVVAGITLLVLFTATVGTRLVLNADEHAQLRHLIRDTVNKLKPFLQRRTSIPGNA
ncbi:MAG: oligosaccharide flippase family protein [Planctomycetes bacterium]|nr:oligosaccharide flippase family protein [Planctomycetota bacterium]